MIDNTVDGKNDRLFWPDFLRDISFMGVILIHVTSVGMNDYNINTGIYFSASLVNCMVRWAVPVFFMISGMFLLDPSHEISTEKLRRKVLKLILIIVVWGIFYSLLDDFSNGYLEMKSLPKAVLYVLKGTGGYHLWFLYTLLLIYLALPVLRILTKNGSLKILKWCTVLWFVFSIGVGWINDLGGDLSCFSLFEINYSFEVVAGYAGYFLIGYVLTRSDFKIKKRIISILLVIVIGVILTMNAACILIAGCEPGVISEPTGILTCLLSVFIFMLCKGIRFNNRMFTGLIHALAADSFAIYLVHVFWITLIFRIFNLDFSVFGDGFILVWFLVILLLSIVTAEILKRIPFLRNIVRL